MAGGAAMVASAVAVAGPGAEAAALPAALAAEAVLGPTVPTAVTAVTEARRVGQARILRV